MPSSFINGDGLDALESLIQLFSLMYLLINYRNIKRLKCTLN